MKVLILNGSPRIGGNTTVAVEELEKVFRAEGVEVETVQVGARDIRGCIACGRCNFVCPTCTCFIMQDIAYKENGRAGERRRVWASTPSSTGTSSRPWRRDCSPSRIKPRVWYQPRTIRMGRGRNHLQAK